MYIIYTKKQTKNMKDLNKMTKRELNQYGHTLGIFDMTRLRKPEMIKLIISKHFKLLKPTEVDVEEWWDFMVNEQQEKHINVEK